MINRKKYITSTIHMPIIGLMLLVYWMLNENPEHETVILGFMFFHGQPYCLGLSLCFSMIKQEMNFTITHRIITKSNQQLTGATNGISQ